MVEQFCRNPSCFSCWESWWNREKKKQIKINQSADIPCIYIKWIERANCLVLSISCSVNASAATPNSKKEQQQSTTDYRKNFVLLPNRRFLS